MTELEKKIQHLLKENQLITFRDFMEHLLYDEEFGYYTNRNTIGREGDFYTSSNVSNYFGELVSKQIVKSWIELGKPSNFAIIEFGAGTGQLAFDLLSSLQNECNELFTNLHYLICEHSEILCSKQKVLLKKYNPKVIWTTLADLVTQHIDAFVLSNEFIDALPVHILRLHQGKLQECFITLSNNQLIQTWQKPLKLHEFKAFLKKSDIYIQENMQIEVGLDAIHWLEQISSFVRRGFVLTIDYGDLGNHLSQKLEGTIRCFYKHVVHNNYLINLGKQDVTADVNFSALITYGKKFGFQTISFERQADFLIKLGLLNKLEQLSNTENSSLSSLKERLALKNFLVPSGFSDRFRVLLQKKTNY